MTIWNADYGKHIRVRRRMPGLTPRQFCVDRGINAVEWSALERGREAPESAEEAMTHFPEGIYDEPCPLEVREISCEEFNRRGGWAKWAREGGAQLLTDADPIC